MILKKLKLFVCVLVLVICKIFLAPNHSNAQYIFGSVGIGAIYVPGLHSFSDLKNYTITNNLTELLSDPLSNIGISLMLDTEYLVNFGFSYYRLDLEENIDSNLSLRSQFFIGDVFLRLPTPPVIDIYIGAGIGYNAFDCISSTCATAYRDVTFAKEGTVLPIHLFIRGALWIGKIYRILASYQMVFNPTVVLKGSPLTENRVIEHKLFGFGLGFEILF